MKQVVKDDGGGVIAGHRAMAELVVGHPPKTAIGTIERTKCREAVKEGNGFSDDSEKEEVYSLSREPLTDRE